MKLKVMKPCEIEAKYIRVELPVRYGDEDIPNDFPMRKGDMWGALIEIDTGRVVGWPSGTSGQMHMKVCDQGIYELMDENHVQLANIDQNYVPSCVPGKYGDYVEFEIGADGKIKDWSNSCTPENVKISFFPKDCE